MVYTIQKPLISNNASLKESYTLCEHLAKTHYENFPVGTRLLPSNLRPHFYAMYAFCRGTDDIGDEVDGDRTILLDDWQEHLNTCYTSASPNHPHFAAIKHTIQKFNIPPEPFMKIIEANRMDQEVSKYSTFDQLLNYCKHSANPVGHIVLYLFGIKGEKEQSISDYTCTALQLTNFWQDVKRDSLKDRIYIPKEDIDAFGVTYQDITRNSATEKFKSLIRFEIERTRQLFREGEQLLQMVPRRLRFDLALFTAGGLKVLQAIEKQNYDVLRKRPKLSKIDFTSMFIGVLTRYYTRRPLLPNSLYQGT